MTNNLGEVPDVIPLNWDDKVYGVTISLAASDDLGFPMSKRNGTYRIPTDPRAFRQWAERVGKTVESTILEILKVPNDSA